jgi:hypothetical protein
MGRKHLNQYQKKWHCSYRSFGRTDENMHRIESTVNARNIKDNFHHTLLYVSVWVYTWSIFKPNFMHLPCSSFPLVITIRQKPKYILHIATMLLFCGPGWHSQYSKSGWSGDQILVGGGGISASVQTGPGAHLASCTMGTRSHSWR